MTMDVVTLDAQAADNGLAMMLQGLLAENLAASDRKRRDFESMSSTFGIGKSVRWVAANPRTWAAS